ncbi:hypothetical protein H7F15_19110 [Pontibacter sp. Tf4]|uniref:hypothetical protein n=1 Tax=Pontibacter sp. Tf4 TaxID=2761620 RepID=UPI001628A3A9|nr:hypothetical protein [Pontibacter sp. Tf4]MBB6613157.1 hypothetical protein [Pontibacter sp. Tf4]
MKKLFIIFCLSLTSCVVSNNSNSTFKRYLTKEEKESLSESGEILKVHTSKYRNGQTHWTGPLRVKYINKKYSFTQVGTWKGYYESGDVFSVAKSDSLGQLEKEQIFELNGIKSLEMIGYDENIGNKVVRKVKLINYRSPLYQDTLVTTHFIEIKKKLIKHGVETYFNELGIVEKTVHYENGKKLK